jgi:transitional endoplasmic reticulum ATPase
MAQDFHMARFEEFKAKGLAAHRQGQWKDARFNLLKAAEHLFELAKETEKGPIRCSRIENAKKLAAQAKAIDESAPPPVRPGAGPKSGPSVPAKGRKVPVDEEDDRRRFARAERPKTRFSDIAGLDDVKEEIRLKLIYPLQHAEKARKYKVRTGGGVLLYGPPGTGKTMIARAIAGEIEAAFFTVKPSEIMSKWVGEAEQNIEELFKTARAEPLSVIFIDEIEALVPHRRDSQSSVMQRVVPQILAELEGFDTASKNPILFLGATNEPWGLDPAVLRPGRFDEKIYVGLPDLAARRRMLDIYLAGRPLEPGVDLDRLAERVDGYSGADIRNVCDKAAGEAFLASIENGQDAPIGQGLLDRVVAEVKPSVKPGDLAKFQKYAEVT